MKYCIFFFLISALVSCMKKDKTAEFDRRWSVLVAAPDSAAEQTAVDEIRQYIRDNEGSFFIYAVDKKNKLHDIQGSSTTHGEEDIVSYEMRVEWEDKDSVGKGWKPKERQHVYDFFLE